MEMENTSRDCAVTRPQQILCEPRGCSRLGHAAEPALHRTLQRQDRQRGARCLFLVALLFITNVPLTLGHDRFDSRHESYFSRRAAAHKELWSKTWDSSVSRPTSTRQPSANLHQRIKVWARLGPWLQSVLPLKTANIMGRFKQRDSPISGPLPDTSTAPPQDDMDLQESDDEDPWDDSPQKPLVPLLASAMDAIFSNRQRLASLSLTAVQYSLIWFLLKSVWKALRETMEELSQESLGGDPYFCSRADLARLVSVLEEPNNDLPDSASRSSSLALLPRAALQLAQDLQNAGLPVRSHPSSGISSIESLFQDMTRSEANILQQCLWRPPASVRQNPDELWDAVLGLDAIKEHILLTVAATSPASSTATTGGTHDNRNLGHLHKTQQAYSSLLSSVSGSSSSSTSTSQHHGMLLYGEPGCGKSYFVQALASKLRLPCLVVTPSVLMRKYVGETNLQVRSLFSLLQNKLFPCIVVLDELDGLFRERHDNEHDASRELKTEFLQWLSGIMTTSSSSGNSKTTHSASPRHPLIVVGATNRPLDVDSAILRRLPQRFYIGLPDFATRCQLIQKMLQPNFILNLFTIISSMNMNFTITHIVFYLKN